MTLALIDADSIIYKAGFAVERATYEVVGEDGEGDLVSAEFDDVAEAGNWIHAVGMDPDAAQIIVSREAEPVENAIQIVKTMLREIERETSGGPAPCIYLSGPDNFRDKIAKVKPYKGNRDKAHKPVHFKAMRDYLIREHSAILSRNCEADDDVCKSARVCRDGGVEHIVVHIDKDLDQIPGRHFNYSKKAFYDVSEKQADEKFWTQVLTGDASDNVGGVYKMGPKAAAYWLSDWEPTGDWWKHIVLAYELSQRKKGCPYPDRDPEEVAIENAQLVYLQRKTDELWLPNGARGHIK